MAAIIEDKVVKSVHCYDFQLPEKYLRQNLAAIVFAELEKCSKSSAIYDGKDHNSKSQ